MDKQNLEPILEDHPFFKDMKKEHIDLLAGCASNVRFEKGDVIFRQDTDADKFYVIREGHVAVDVTSSDRGTLTIATLGAGNILGWSWLFPPYLWHFDARATEPTHAIALDGRCLRGKCDEDTRFGYELLKRFSAIVIDRLQATRLQLIDVYGPRATPSS
jgi:CRP-like cAMP-binding protein